MTGSGRQTARGSKGRSERELDVLIEHYRAIRTDILSKVEMRDRYSYLCIVGSGIIFYFQNNNNPDTPVLFTIPLLIIITSILFTQVDQIIGMMARWLKVNYSEELIVRLGYSIDHWDSSNIGETLIKSSVFQARYLSMGAIFVGIGYTALLNRVAIADSGGIFLILKEGLAGNWRHDALNRGLSYPIELIELVLMLAAPIIAYMIVTFSGRSRASFHTMGQI